MSVELQFIFTVFVCFQCNLSNHILSLPHIASVKWGSLGFLLFDYKQIVTMWTDSVIFALVAEHFAKENSRSENAC